MSDSDKNRSIDFVVSYPDLDHVIFTQIKDITDGNIIYLHGSHHGQMKKKKTPTDFWVALFALLLFSTQRAVVCPPGAKLGTLASFFFSKRTYAIVLKPYLAEMQEEYFEALSERRLWKARWVRVRGVICFWSHVLLQLPVSATRLAKKLWTVSGG